MKAYLLKLELAGTRSGIWRQVLVPEGATFHELHLVIQGVMGWDRQDGYRFEFPKLDLELTEDPEVLEQHRKNGAGTRTLEKSKGEGRNDGTAKVIYLDRKRSMQAGEAAHSGGVFLGELLPDQDRFCYAYEGEEYWECEIVAEEVREVLEFMPARCLNGAGIVLPEEWEELADCEEFSVVEADRDARAVSLSFSKEWMRIAAFREMWSEAVAPFCIEGKAVRRLGGVLQRLSGQQLKALASQLELQGRSRMSGAVLREALASALKEPERLDYYLTMGGEEGALIMGRLAFEGSVPWETVNPEGAFPLIQGGVAFLFRDGTLVMPTEIRTALRKLLLSPEIGWLHGELSLADRFFNAAGNLYGAISFEELEQIAAGYELFTPDMEAEELEEAAQALAEYRNTGYFCLDGFLCSSQLMEVDLGPDVLVAQAGAIGYFVPESAAKLLRFANPAYAEHSVGWNGVRDCLMEAFSEKEYSADILAGEMEIMLRAGDVRSCIEFYGQCRGGELDGDQIDLIRDPLIGLIENTRRWDLGAHTRQELREKVRNLNGKELEL